MESKRRLPWWGAVVLAILGLGAVYAGPLRTGFLNDDHIFIEEAQLRPLAGSISGPGPLGGHYRPLSRQIYFAALAPLAGNRPLVFHAVNAVLFVAALALLADLLRALLPAGGVMAGLLYFALLPMQRVNLTWISCAQDLLALTGALGAAALHRRGRGGAAALAYLAAVASKESALPLPAALLAWDLLVARRPFGRALARVGPLLAIGLAWTLVAFGLRGATQGAPTLSFAPGAFAAGYVHLVQSLLGLEAGPAMLAGLRAVGPSVLPLLLLGPLAFWYATRRDDGAAAKDGAPAPAGAGAIAALALAWLVAFGIAAGPVASSWSGYYYTLAAVGGALLVGLALRRGGAVAWVLLTAGLLWWHGGAVEARAFAVAPRPWAWTAHVTSFYLDRAAALTDTLSRQLVALEPDPPDDARFFFATLPPWAGFQTGNGALLRRLYHAPGIASYFYSQFSESTAAGHPCRFLFWDGTRLERLYQDAASPMFQVGSDLLLLDHPAGAAHAFRRALEAGEDPMDNLYWLGWAELLRGRRDDAESAWRSFGARDDSLYWMAHLRAARNALLDDRDTLTAKRHLAKAIEFGIGRPEAHAVLGELMLDERPKWAMLELKVATTLNPADWMARRDLLHGLVVARLDDAARAELETLKHLDPGWESDPQIGAAARALAARGTPGSGVVAFR